MNKMTSVEKKLFFNYVKSDDVKNVKKMLKKNKKLADSVDEYGRTALFFLKSPTMASLICNNIGDYTINKLSEFENNENSLWNNDNPEIVKILIESKIDVNHENKFGETALFFQTNLEIIKLLVDAKISLSHKNNSGQNAFQFANYEVIKFFVESDIHFSKGVLGKVLYFDHINLSIQARREAPEIAKLILEKLNDYEYLFTMNKNKETPLMTTSEFPKIQKVFNDFIRETDSFFNAVERNEIDKVKRMLNKNKKIVNRINKQKQNALFVCESAEMVNLLVDNGIDIYYYDRLGEEQNAIFFAKNVEVAKALIDNDAAIYFVDEYNKTPIFTIKDPDVVKMLINEYEFDVNDVDVKKRNALFYQTDPKVVKVLIDSGIDVNNLDKYDANVLFNKNIEHKTMKMLINSGIDVNAINYEGENALFYQVNVSNVKILLENGIDYLVEDGDFNNIFHFNKLRNLDEKIKIKIVNEILKYPDSRKLFSKANKFGDCPEDMAKSNNELKLYEILGGEVELEYDY